MSNQTRCHFLQIPFAAFTATATPTVQKDIINNLKLKNVQKCCSSFDRYVFILIFERFIVVFFADQIFTSKSIPNPRRRK